ncbi:MAG TPA: APC family permease [Gemmatimonadaceae bacterium]|nr:APC family permease [Gemmatimonadaceae bacterium]
METTTVERAAVVREPGRLRRALGLGFGLAVTVGMTIGAGILRAPTDVATRLPSPVLFFAAWVVGGLYALIAANSLTELGTMLPRSGGQYVFARYALGPFAGFVVGWNDWISTCGSVAAVAIVLAEALGALVGPLAPHAMAVAVAIVVAFTALLWRGVQQGDQAQRLTSALKALAFLALVTACFVLGPRSGAPRVTAPPAIPTGAALAGAFIVAMQGVIFTYDGWSAPFYFSEEVREPGRELPRAVLGGLLVVMGIYLLVNAAFVWVLPLPAIARSNMAAASAAAVVFGSRGDMVVRLLVVLALPSAVNALLLAASRVLYAMGRDGMAPRIAERVSEGGTPRIALFASAIVTVLFLVTGTFETVIARLAFLFVANYALSMIAVFVLRRREPDAPRPYRAWGYPWSTVLALLLSVSFLVGMGVSDWSNTRIALLLVVISYPVFALLVRRAGRA